MNAPQTTRTLDALFDLPADDRYAYFLEEGIRQGRVWTLAGAGGFVAFCDEEGRDCFPFWPAPELAEALANHDWSDCSAEPLELAVFMDRWLTGMSRDDRLVSVFSAPDGTGIVVDPLELLEDLRKALGGS